MFGKNLAKIRKSRKLSQYDLAEKMGFSRGQIANYEQGTRQPDFETLQKFADFFEVSTDYLLGRTDNPSMMNLQMITDDIFPSLPTALMWPKDIKKIRERYKLTMEEVAQKADIPLEVYKKYESEGVPNKEDSMKLSNFYNDLDKNFNYSKKTNELEKTERDIAKRLEEFKNEIENSDGLAFSGEPLSEEAKESLIESMEHIFRQTQRINKKYTPKKYRDDE